MLPDAGHLALTPIELAGLGSGKGGGSADAGHLALTPIEFVSLLARAKRGDLDR